MKGYWTDEYYVGIMPDGRKGYFCSEQEYQEAYQEYLMETEN